MSGIERGACGEIAEVWPLLRQVLFCTLRLDLQKEEAEMEKKLL